MIEASLTGRFEAIAARLTRRAKALAEAGAEQRRRPGSPLNWRSARLLWPLFTQG